MISTQITKKVFVLVVDFLILSFSLYLALSLRDLRIVEQAYFLEVFRPFLFIIFVNILAFYIYGLYDQMSTKIYTELNQRILASLLFSSILGAIIFYTTNYFIIAPKTILIIYIIISSLLLYLWRKNVRKIIKSPKRNRILLVAEGQELLELQNEILNNRILNIQKVESIDLANLQALDIYNQVKSKVLSENYNILAINMHHPYIKNSISLFYELLLDKITVVNFADLYEEVLQKIPLQNIDAG